MMTKTVVSALEIAPMVENVFGRIRAVQRVSMKWEFVNASRLDNMVISFLIKDICDTKITISDFFR